MGTAQSPVLIAASALVHETARIGRNTKVWAFAQIAEAAVIGNDCILGNGVYIDRHVKVGNRVWIQNKALLYQGVEIADDVFIGPGVCFTNDRRPKSGMRRSMKSVTWKVGRGASIGANATVLPDTPIGACAVVGAGSVVTKPVPDHALVYGNPAVQYKWVCICGTLMPKSKKFSLCKNCKKTKGKR